MIVAGLLTKAKKLNNWDEDATAGGLWTTDQTYIAKVPAGKRWFLYGGIVNPDVYSTVFVAFYNTADKVILELANYAAGTAAEPYPEVANVGQFIFPVVMDAGEYVRAYFAVAQTGAAACSCVVLEVGI